MLASPTGYFTSACDVVGLKDWQLIGCLQAQSDAAAGLDSSFVSIGSVRTGLYRSAFRPINRGIWLMQW